MAKQQSNIMQISNFLTTGCAETSSQNTQQPLTPCGDFAAVYRRDFAEFADNVVYAYARNELARLQAMPPNAHGRDLAISDFLRFLAEERTLALVAS